LRSSAAISLFLVLCLPLAGLSGWLLLERQLLRHEIKQQLLAGIDRAELVHWAFGPEKQAQLEWEHEGEFEYLGEMYDVVERAQRGDTLHLWCWWDHEETALNRQLQDLVQITLGQDPQRQEQRHQRIQWLTWQFAPPAGPLLPRCLPARLKPVLASLPPFEGRQPTPLPPPPWRG
jgi:hypothetical protein